MRVALDTNILAYAEGVNGAAMKRTALELVEKIPEGAALLPVQTLGELFNLLVRKAGRTPAKARKAILSWKDAFPLIETSAEVMLGAADLATDHDLSIGTRSFSRKPPKLAAVFFFQKTCSRDSRGRELP